MSSAFWTFRLFVTAVDCDYARRIAEVQAAVLPLEAQAMDTDRAPSEHAVDTDTSREAIARLLTACGEGLGMEALNICRELLRQWQTKSSGPHSGSDSSRREIRPLPVGLCTHPVSRLTRPGTSRARHCSMQFPS